jgi:hypothetical protein
MSTQRVTPATGSKQPVEQLPISELAAMNPGLDARGLARLAALEQLLAEDDQEHGLSIDE